MSLVEVLYPEKCAWCGATFGDKPWACCGARVSGLRRWDRPHACQECLARLLELPVVNQTLPGNLPAWGGVTANADLVQVVRDWKYHGLRGLAWPLSQLLAGAFIEALPSFATPMLFVPVPLHRRRQRERGFNQAAILSSLLAANTGHPVAEGLVQRRRNTPQQAKIQDPGQRFANVDAAFLLRNPHQGSLNVLLVDDLVTTGATACAVANSMCAAGIRVQGVICLGLARGHSK